MYQKEFILKYGCNPHQIPARIYMRSGTMPIEILNGAPGYINMLDALNSWQLVKELKQVLGLPAAASFKHVSPAGAAVGTPLNDTLKKMYFVEGKELSPLSTAYTRARGADRMASFGDWVALSDTVDIQTAKLLSKEVSDGIIAPSYNNEALEILKRKKKGKYPVIAIDPDYNPPNIETRDIYGISFEQKSNDLVPDSSFFQNIVTESKDLPEYAKRDLLVATIAVKYTQSNSVCYAFDGQVIGLGAGQQSRIHCTRLAGSKTDLWHLRQHPAVLSLNFKTGLKRPDKDNAIGMFLEKTLTAQEEEIWKQRFEQVPVRLTAEEKSDWLKKHAKNVSMSSDAFFPFRDNIDRASASGVKYIMQPGMSVRDEEIIQAANGYGMVMVCSGKRFFHH